jgi:hypothetical protein
MAEEPQQQRDNRAARKQQLNGQIRAGVPCELNQCVHDEGMLSAVRIPLISDHDRFVARLFRVQVNFKGAVPGLPGFPTRRIAWNHQGCLAALVMGSEAIPEIGVRR